MTCWNYLPAEIKQYVVKKLDFMSRVSLGSTCRLNYHIVYSTKLELPRVRFGYKNGRCLIVIYTGIEKFLRLEFGPHEHGAVIRKHFGPERNYHKNVALIRESYRVFETLISLLAHQSILIKVMEWEVSPEDFERFIGRLILNILDGRKFWMKEIAMRQQTWKQILYKFPFDMLHFDELENIRQMALTIHPQRLTLFMVYQYEQCINGKWLYSTDMRMKREAWESNDIIRIKTYNEKRNVETPPTTTAMFLNKNIYRILGTETEDDDIVSCCHKSECGAFVYTVEKQFEYHLDYLKSLKCGLGSFCKRCSDSFEYWYYQNLPRRVLHEPFWTDFILNIDEQLIRDELRGKYERDVRERIQKTSKNKKMELSWGFRREVSIENEGEQGKKKKLRKKKKKNPILENLKDSEDVSFENSEDSEAMEYQKQISDFMTPRFIVTVVLFPILVSFIFYLVWS